MTTEALKNDAPDTDRPKRAVDAKLTKRLLQRMKRYWRVIILCSVLSLITAALQLVGPLAMQRAIDLYIPKADFAGILRMSGLYFGSTVFLFAVEYVIALLIAYVGQDAMLRLRNELFGHMQELHIGYYDQMPVGRLMSRLTGDVQALNELFSQGIMTLAGDLFLIIAILALMIWTSPTLTGLVLLIVPLMVASARVFSFFTRSAYRDTRERMANLNTFLQENLSGMRTVQAYNRETRQLVRFEELNSSYREAMTRTVLYYSIFIPVVELLAAASLALIIWYGGVATISGALSLGTVYLFIQYSQRLFLPIRELSEKFNIYQTALAAAERVFKLLDTTPVVVTENPRPVPKCRGELTMEDVWFAYQGEDWVLRDVNLTIPRGTMTALVGATGSGKSTITNLIARFYDVQRGRIAMDGVDIREFDPRLWRRAMAIVQQEPFLFTGTIESNIRLGHDEITDEQVQDAARRANADEFIQSLPDGYKTEVRERGATLSTGQKQLLVLARAFAFDPDILILDEATANIDTETEVLIQKALENLLKNRTAIVVAHRLSTIQHADQIVVLHRGKIQEIGRHSELLQQDGLYRKLYELQFAHSDPESVA